MNNTIFQTLDQLGVEILCLIIPGLFLTLGGIRNILTRQAISVGRDGYFRWKKPVLLRGKDAVDAGGCYVTLGVFFLLLGIASIIGFFV